MNKYAKFQWVEPCQESLDKLKNKMATAPILVFPYWKKEFHVHVDTSFVALGIVLTQLGEGALDHPISFASRKLSTTEKKYMTIEREGLTMVYELQKFRHYLLGGNFQMYTNHSVLKYLVNKLVLGGNICKWLLLFQEFDFEVVVKLARLNVRPDHLSISFGTYGSVPLSDFSLSHLVKGNKVTLALNDLSGAFNLTLESKVTF